MENFNFDLVKSFDGVLQNIVDGKTYLNLPPRGPRDLAVLSESEIEAKRLNENGESVFKDSNYNPKTFKNISVSIEESNLPKDVKYPTEEFLNGLTICGIDGSNERIGKASFYFILARAAIINFRYSKKPEVTPYFYTKMKDASAVVWIDGNIFKENLVEFTNNKFKKEITNESGVNILESIKRDSSKPFLVGYNHSSSEKSPSGHALGWAVKLQQSLELLCLEEIDDTLENKAVCIKDGPLFSTSSSEKDNIDGLRPITRWTNQVLVCISKNNTDSKLILETLSSYPDLVKIFFPDDEVRKEDIIAIGSDTLLLQRILAPGQRTPFIKAVPIARQGVCTKATEAFQVDFMPLCCYYRGRTQPQSFIRIEIPSFMWEKNKQLVEDAISTVAWQHELGGREPYIQSVAEELCMLKYEKDILEHQTLATLDIKKLNIAIQD